MFWRFGGHSNEGQGDEAISGLNEDTKLLENRKPHMYHIEGRVQPRRSRPSTVTDPFRSKTRVSRGEDKEPDINEASSGLRHMRKRIHRRSLLSPKSTSLMVHREYVPQRWTIDLSEVLDLAMTNTNHKTTNELEYDTEAPNKTPGSHEVAARAEVNATAPHFRAKLDGIPYSSTGDFFLPRLANTESTEGHMQRQARDGTIRIPHTEFNKLIDHRIRLPSDQKALPDVLTFANKFPRQAASLVDSLVVNDDQSTENTQKDHSAVTGDKRFTHMLPNYNTALHAAVYGSYGMRTVSPEDILGSSDEESHPNPIQQTQVSGAPTGHPISSHHPDRTKSRQRYHDSLLNIRAVQSQGRHGLPVGTRKDKTFEKLSNAFSASRHYTISQDHTAGQATRKSHLLANFGRRCGSNMDEREQLKVADDELDPPAIDMESVSAFARHDYLKPHLKTTMKVLRSD